MKINNLHTSVKGQTFTEVIVSVLLVGFMTVSLYAGFSAGFGIMGRTREDLRATQIMMQQLEAIRLCTWQQLSNAPIRFTDWYDPDGSATGGRGVLYAGTIECSPPDSIPATATYRTNMYLVRVSLAWTNNSFGRPLVNRRSMESHYARMGLQNFVWGTL